eukprot:TRINITY_DN19101_c0_g1_i1.p2 TRINITY_DN19101_c0_g1~~TRINITY_DN19101_c0_g1_i1.p2  ORF type:complete len:247 (+),score=96.62 TRINITY_DN19101_c0_g1_i1:98-838(+)
MLRRATALWRKYNASEFVYTKNVSAGQGARHTQAISCVHVFTLSLEKLNEIDKQFADRPHESNRVMPVELALIPLFDTAFPSFWHGIEELCVDLKTDGFFCEGFSGEYQRSRRRPRKLHRFPWARFRDQRAPWPWGLAHPCMAHGGDLHDYTTIQRFFPSRRPGADEDEARIEHCLKEVDRVGLMYDALYSAVAFNHRVMPKMAERLEAKGYVLLEKKELEAGTSQNELYSSTLQAMVAEIEALTR